MAKANVISIKPGRQADHSSAIAAMAACLERDEQAVNSVLHGLYGEIPSWVPHPSIERAKRIIQKLSNDGFSVDSICQRVAEAEKDKLTHPGIVTDQPAFAQLVYELAHIRYAISLGKAKGLRILAGEQAEHGQRFKDGRQHGACGPIRKYIATLLAKSPEMRNPQLWQAIMGKPPKGWQAYETTRLGKYLEGPGTANMKYGRFCNVCGEERRKLKEKITG